MMRRTAYSTPEYDDYLDSGYTNEVDFRWEQICDARIPRSAAIIIDETPSVKFRLR